MRKHDRLPDALRPITITRKYTSYAEGSVLIEYGNTQVICNASIVPGVPRFLKDSGQGWLTAEYGMLPRSTQDRIDREAARGKQSGRTLEIQRLIGRVLRMTLDLNQLGENTIIIDCDVIQADGGTRTASITGGCIALIDALQHMQHKNLLKKINPLRFRVAAVSVGLSKGKILLDLDYKEDSSADTDLNVIMTESGALVEIQGTAEKTPFELTQLTEMLAVAKKGIDELFEKQAAALALSLFTTES